ncbi:hypothetical protein HELRODRAFT_168718 [Helobdella robusta]|uniref:Uncharacterized protein n=1 Tax=Helobdella robusta TaxID=6412 RepID=T1F0W1_HELRO|nr:hypothetical protein HELRODRAFT_168718 [Helobdella robusta]ESO08810.1 hypothetical protein HELRODRAFT_168718 [Helobdella robusta]
MINSIKSRGKVKSKKKTAEKNFTVTKYGVGGVNRPNIKSRGTFCGFTALHYAAYHGHLECVQMLSSHGALVEQELGASQNKMTPLMIACQRGHFSVARWLVQSASAKPDKKDKLKRTSLMLACMNGHAHILTYLLHIGCDSNAKDSSGNSPLHYAVAYGWYFCVKILLSVDTVCEVTNDWKLHHLAENTNKSKEDAVC